jgi:hypothetical protein
MPMNHMIPMFARRREAKKLAQVARMLQELDAAAKRPAAAPRRSRIAFGR